MVLVLGQVLPFVLLLAIVCWTFTVWFGHGVILLPVRELPVPYGLQRRIVLPVLCAVLLAYLPRILAVKRFRQDWRSAFLHPLGIVLLLCVQWYALARKLSGRTVSWRNRAYAEQ